MTLTMSIVMTLTMIFGHGLDNVDDGDDDIGHGPMRPGRTGTGSGARMHLKNCKNCCGTLDEHLHQASQKSHPKAKAPGINRGWQHGSAFAILDENMIN